MPELVIQDQYVEKIPRFVLPKEFTEPKPESTPVAPVAPLTEAKPAQQAPAIPAEEITTEPKVKEGEAPGKETTEKDLEKATIRRFERRIERAIRAEAEAEAQAGLLEKELAELRAKASIPPTLVGAPKMEDYTDVQDYAKAYAEFEKQGAIQEYEQKRKKESLQYEQQKIIAGWEAKVDEATAKYEDFEEVVGKFVPASHWGFAMAEAENGADIAYYLSKHPKEIEKIVALNPSSQIREIGKLEAKLAADAQAPKTPSKAPAPIVPVSVSATVSNDEIRPNMPFEEYRKIGNKMFRGR